MDYCPNCCTRNNKFTLEEAEINFNNKFGEEY